MSHAVIAAYAGCALIWGTTWYAIRVCIAEYPTLPAVALRFALAAALLLPLAARLRPWPERRAWGYLVLAGILDAAAYGLVYFGEERVSGAIAAVLYGTQPLILAVLLVATGMERLTRRHLVGAVVSLAGVAVLFLDQLDISVHQALGVVMVLGSVVAATLYSMIMKRHSIGVHRVVSTTIFLSITAIVLGALALGSDYEVTARPDVAATLALVYLAVVGSVIAFLLYFWLLDQTGLQVTSTLVFVFPLVALAADALFEHELPLSARTVIGAAITLCGLAVSLRRRGTDRPGRRGA